MTSFDEENRRAIAALEAEQLRAIQQKAAVATSMENGDVRVWSTSTAEGKYLGRYYATTVAEARAQCAAHHPGAPEIIVFLNSSED